MRKLRLAVVVLSLLAPAGAMLAQDATPTPAPTPAPNPAPAAEPSPLEALKEPVPSGSPPGTGALYQ